jgi:alpha-1,2-mannosyltransferase
VGIGVGIAAAIKLTPAIFIVFFLLAGRTRAALVAAGTFVGCGLIGFLVAPSASARYWVHLFYDTKRVGAPYISNQSPYGAAIRLAEGASHIGHWWLVVPLVFGAAGLAVAVVLARRDDWLGAATVTGTAGLLVSPISWAHHWVWILPALVLLVRGGKRIAAAVGYLVFAVAPFWFTPHSGRPDEYGFHWLVTLVANCYLIAGLVFLGFMAWQAFGGRVPAPPVTGAPDVSGVSDRLSSAGLRTRRSSHGPFGIKKNFFFLPNDHGVSVLVRRGVRGRFNRT